MHCSQLGEQQSGGSNYSVGQVTGLAVHLGAAHCSYSKPLGKDDGLLAEASSTQEAVNINYSQG